MHTKLTNAILLMYVVNRCSQFATQLLHNFYCPKSRAISTHDIRSLGPDFFFADGDGMKTVNVVAAIIREGNKIFATQRGYGDFKDGWEFPGGKIEPGETPQQALAREIREELGIEISVGNLFTTIEYDYPAFHLSMQCFWCRIVEGELVLNEHEAARWLDVDTLDSVAWLPADWSIIRQIAEHLHGSGKL